MLLLLAGGSRDSVVVCDGARQAPLAVRASGKRSEALALGLSLAHEHLQLWVLELLLLVLIVALVLLLIRGVVPVLLNWAA